MSNKIIDISGLNRFLDNVKTYIDSSSASKQDILVSGDNIKTVNGESLLGTGNIVIENNVASTPDWVANRFETGFIKNRTHYINNKSRGESINVTNTIAGETLFGGLSAGQVVRIQNITDENAIQNIEAVYVYVNNGDRISLPVSGPSVQAVIVTVDNALAIVQNNNSYGIDNVLQFDVYAYVKTLDDFYISPNIARRNDVSVLSNDITEQLTNKQDTLVSGTNIKTINGENILGSGNIIIDNVTESTVSGWGFTKNTGTYSKPSGGIPKTDLASDIQTSLDKADTALQSYTEKYTGTITGIKMNGASKGTSGVVDLGTVITSHQDISGKQDKLVSGTNIKTINGTSILGSGDITISSGNADANVQAVDTGDIVDDVNVDYATKSYVDNKVANISLTDYATIAYVDGLVGDINSVLESIINGGGGVSLITFTINGTECQAEEGMTWEDWVNSDYSSHIAIGIEGEQIYVGWHSIFIENVISSDVIIPNYAYTSADNLGGVN